jgi:hypothetical protein
MPKYSLPILRPPMFAARLRHQQLVVHTVVDPLHAGQHLDRTATERSGPPRIEQPDLDVRVRIDQRDRRVA